MTTRPRPPFGARLFVLGLGAFVLSAACDGRLDFDDGTDPSGGGNGATAAAGAGDDSAGEGGGGASTMSRCPECEAVGLKCDHDGYPCVECFRDDDCQDSERRSCDRTLHRCVGCNNNRNCAPGYVCDERTHDCVVSCGSDGSGCGPDYLSCDMGHWSCSFCTDDRQCERVGPGLRCAEGGTRCVECTKDIHCTADPERPVCDPVLFECVGCSDSSKCGRGEVCDPTSHTCTTTLEPTAFPAR